MGNTVDVNENEYVVSDFPTGLAAIRKLEATLKSDMSGEHSNFEAQRNKDDAMNSKNWLGGCNTPLAHHHQI